MLDLSRFASINATGRDESRTTERYQFIPTMRVVDVLRSHGWFPVMAQEARTRDRHGYQKHMIRFRQENPPIDGVEPEIIMVGSHGGLSAWKMFCGLNVRACMNGLIVASDTFANYTIRHIGYADSKVASAIEHITTDVPKILQVRRNWESIKLTVGQCAEFARFAYSLRHDVDAEPASEWTLKGLLTCRHREQAELNLWNVYNRIQENAMGGNYRHGAKSRKARGVSAIDANVQINSALWLHAEQIAKSEGEWQAFDRLTS